MYTLRIIFKNGVQSNECLGKHYNYIDKEVSPVDFKDAMERIFDNSAKHYEDLVYAFVVHSDGSVIRPLYNEQKAYIMMNGKTIDNLSFN